MSEKKTGSGRRALVLVGVLTILGVGGFLAVKRFHPYLFDREATNADELAKLKAAPLTPAAPTVGDWPQWLGPARDGRASAGPLRTDWAANPPSKVWETACGGGFSSFAVVGGKLYTQDKLGDNERVRCLSADTGAVLWSHDTPTDYAGLQFGTGPRATPAVHDGRVYAVGATGRLVCLETKPDGPPTLAWEHDYKAEFRSPQPRWGFAGSPVIEGDLVIVQPGGRDGAVMAFDRITGVKKCGVGRDDAGYSSPTVATAAGVRQVVAVTAETILGVSLEGRELWRHEWRTEHGGNIATPQVIGDYVFVSSNYQKGCVLLRLVSTGDGVRAEQVYFRKNRVMMNHHSTCVHRDGFLYGYDGDKLRCVDLRAGEAKDDWVAADANGRDLAKGAVILADKYLIGQTQTGALFLADADPAGFRFRGKLDGVIAGSQCWALPVLVNGRLYVRDEAKIVCLDVR